MNKILACVLLIFVAITVGFSQEQPKATEMNVDRDLQIVSILKEMATLRSQINSVQDSHAKAKTWLDLNRKADELAVRMTQLMIRTPDSGPPTPTPDLERIVEKSTTLGITLAYCEIGTDWVANFTGYENYLALWPDGPNADEAYWKSKTEPNACGDFEGTVEEYQQGIDSYSDFIKRFPNSSYAARAKSQLDAYQAGLREEQKSQANPATPHN